MGDAWESEEAEVGTVVMTQTIDGAREKEAILAWDMQIAPSRWLRDGVACYWMHEGRDRWGPARGHGAIGSAADHVDA